METVSDDRFECCGQNRESLLVWSREREHDQNVHVFKLLISLIQYSRKSAISRVASSTWMNFKFGVLIKPILSTGGVRLF